MFKPGSYNVNVNVGFYTQVLGLGLSPDAVNINGSVHVEADWFPPNNATQNFWRGAENLSVTPTGGTDRWAVSQAAPYRRMHVRGNLVLDDGGWASGGWFSDVKVDGQVNSGSQQQWISRNSQFGSWAGSNWNMVFVGTQGAPGNTFPSPPYTNVGADPGGAGEAVPVCRQQRGRTRSSCPSLRSNSSGTTWAGGTAAGNVAADQPVPHREGRRDRRLHQRGAGRRAEPAVHSRACTTSTTPSGSPGRTPSCWAWAWPPSSRTTGSWRCRSPMWTV